jgi:hypothetical protein
MAITGSWCPSGNDQNRLTNRMRNAIQQLQFSVSELLALQNIMAQMVVASDYTTIEAYFSVPTGSGQAAHDVLGTASTALQAAGVQGLIQRFG